MVLGAFPPVSNLFVLAKKVASSSPTCKQGGHFVEPMQASHKPSSWQGGNIVSKFPGLHHARSRPCFQAITDCTWKIFFVRSNDGGFNARAKSKIHVTSWPNNKTARHNISMLLYHSFLPTMVCLPRTLSLGCCDWVVHTFVFRPFSCSIVISWSNKKFVVSNVFAKNNEIVGESEVQKCAHPILKIHAAPRYETDPNSIVVLNPPHLAIVNAPQSQQHVIGQSMFSWGFP